MYESNIISMQKLIENFTSINLKNEIILLQLIINEITSMSIFKQKSCEKFKKWWCERLITLKKTMTVHKKFHKRCYSNFNFDNFKKARNKYFHKIRKIKISCWIEFFENAIKKIFFWHTNSSKTTKLKNCFRSIIMKKFALILIKNAMHLLMLYFYFFRKFRKIRLIIL